MKFKKIMILCALALMVQLPMGPASAQAADSCKIAWSHYTGWEPYAYMKDSGIMDKHAKQNGVEVSITLVNDYIESINQYTAGAFDGVTATTMDGLAIPAVGGVDTTVLIVGDYSNGNDGALIKDFTKKKMDVADLKGRKVMLVELSVSHYLLARALDKNGMSERDLKVVNTSDADIGALFSTGAEGTTVVTWNPILMSARNEPGAHMVFDSSMIPGEIVDTLLVRTSMPEGCKKAIVGAWFETMGIMSGRGNASNDALAFMAKFSGSTLAEFRAQLGTTYMFYNPRDAAGFTRGAMFKKTMDEVRKFSFDHGLFGQGASSVDFVGIEFPDGSVMGNKGNVKLRFNTAYMEAAAK
ncbi:MAG: putative urea ABC transporter substrate-binding protein [Nitrospinota bacterium]|nr:putative urea ABC transporter substrate-binding protein [Nitrospinota bacterium]